MGYFDPPEYDPPDPPCEVCLQEVDACDCPVCPYCETSGEPGCYDDPQHGLVMSSERKAIIDKRRAEQEAEIEAERKRDESIGYYLDAQKLEDGQYGNGPGATQ